MVHMNKLDFQGDLRCVKRKTFRTRQYMRSFPIQCISLNFIYFDLNVNLMGFYNQAHLLYFTQGFGRRNHQNISLEA